MYKFGEILSLHPPPLPPAGRASGRVRRKCLSLTVLEHCTRSYCLKPHSNAKSRGTPFKPLLETPPNPLLKKEGKKEKSGKISSRYYSITASLYKQYKSMIGMKRAKMKGLRKKKKTSVRMPSISTGHHSLPTDTILAEPLPQASPD